jgi:hypothetical protein
MIVALPAPDSVGVGAGPAGVVVVPGGELAVVVVPPGCVAVVVVVVVPVELTVTVPLIAEWWTVHQKTYVPGWENVQSPLHFVADAASVVPTGTVPAQLGLTGPLRHSRPCFVSDGLLKVTDMPVATVRCDGCHANSE